MQEKEILFIPSDETDGEMLRVGPEKTPHEIAHAAFMKWPGVYSPPMDFGADCPHCYPYQRELARAREVEAAREKEQLMLPVGDRAITQLVPARAQSVDMVMEASTLPAQKEELYTTVKRGGRTMVVPYSMGDFELLRAVELIVAGTSVTAALALLASGHLLVAAGMGAVAAFEFICGTSRRSKHQ